MSARPAAIEDGGVSVPLPAGVHRHAERIELECQLLGVRAGLELAAVDRRPRVLRQQLSPAAHLRGNGVAHGSRPAVHLDRRRREEATAREPAALRLAALPVAPVEQDRRAP